MSIISRRARRALLAAAVPAALAATALPAGADAASVRVATVGLQQGQQIQYTAAPGEANNLRVSFTGLHILIDDSAPLTGGNGCVIDGNGNAVCVPGTLQAQYSLGDGRDTVRNLAPHAAKFDMGADDDTYFGALRVDSVGANTPAVQSIDLIGGAGADLLTYRSSQRAVTVTAGDGLVNDGDRGKENVRLDWEHYEGSNGNDTLTGTNDPTKTEQYTGFAGDDTLFGLDGTDIFNEGSAPSGADAFHGQSGADRILYSQRTTPVTIDMANLARNSGAAGEGDFIDPNTNDAIGGLAGDTLIGGSGANVFNGAGGVDTLRGNAGPDTLTGGSGVDKLFGGTEGDTLNTADNEEDELMRCEAGIDTLNRDLKDVEATECETVNSFGVLKLAPAAITAEAGETAKLRMTWSHPKSWKLIRKVELRIADAGNVVVRPAAERIVDEGAVDVLRSSRLTRRGKDVTAHLALRLDKRLAGETLDVDVAATDIKGHRQLQRGVGTIEVAG
jgi:hypothetical protein